jgi:hypothetical protein
MKLPINLSTGMLGILIILLCAGVVFADPSVNQTPEIQGISVVTSMNAIGTVTQTENIAWVISNLPIGTSLAAPDYPMYDPESGEVLDWPTHFGPLFPDPTAGQVLYTTTYDEMTNAVDGATTYDKTMAVSTANQVGNQNNIKADKTTTFDAVGSGRMTSAENILMDGAGMYDMTANHMMCPFAADTSLFIPPFCNIAKMGSSVDITTVSLVTQAKERSVASSADFPVEIGYSISATGIGNAPAIGSAEASMNLHIQEGRLNFLYQFGPGDDLATVYHVDKTEDLAYSEKTTASGYISGFSKTMNYKSGMVIY